MRGIRRRMMGQSTRYAKWLDEPIQFAEQTVKDVLVGSFGGEQGNTAYGSNGNVRGIKGIAGELTHRQAMGVKIWPLAVKLPDDFNGEFTELRFFTAFAINAYQIYSGASSLVMTPQTMRLTAYGYQAQGQIVFLARTPHGITVVYTGDMDLMGYCFVGYNTRNHFTIVMPAQTKFVPLDGQVNYQNYLDFLYVPDNLLSEYQDWITNTKKWKTQVLSMSQYQGWIPEITWPIVK